MIDIIVLIIVVIFFAALLVYFMPYSIAMFLVNISIIVLIVAKANFDIKKDEMFSYYMLGAFITSIMYIARQAFMPFFRYMRSFLIIDFVQALLLIFVFAHLSKLVYVYSGDYGKKFVKKYVKKQK